MLKGARALRVLLRVEQADAVVVPAHPPRIVCRIGRRGRIRAQRQRSRARSHLHHRHVVVLAHRKVDEVLIEAAIVDFGGDGDGPGRILRHLEPIAHNLRAARSDGVVVGDDARVPHLMQIVQRAANVDKAIGKAVRRRIERAVGLERSGVHQGAACGVFGLELHPALVKIALLGNEVVPDALVLDDDGNRENVARRNVERLSCPAEQSACRRCARSQTDPHSGPRCSGPFAEMRWSSSSCSS